MGEETTKSAPGADPEFISEKDAASTRVLIKEDICKLRLSIARAKAQIAGYEAAIEECYLALSDIDRREAGVKYPEPPKKPEAKEGE